MKKFKVNENCISCGACVAIAPEVFDFNDDMQASAKKENNIIDKMDDETKEKAMNALEGCPVSAIELIDDDENVDCNDDCENCSNEENCDCQNNCENCNKIDEK